MKIWRGIHTKQSRATVLAERFHLLPEKGDIIPLLVDKILKNLDDPYEEKKLSSFSKSKEIALRYAGNRGWLIEIEIENRGVCHPEGMLESAKSRVSIGSEEESQLSEALETIREDQEVFLKEGDYSLKIINITMVGSFSVGH